jgi:hypothetical protein
VYTNELDERLGDSILLTLFGAAIKYRLEELKMRLKNMRILFPLIWKIIKNPNKMRVFTTQHEN